MTVLRIVANVAASDVAAGEQFYRDILGLEVLMDLGFVRTYGSRRQTTVQLSVLTEGGSGTEVPALSIEVDDLEAGAGEGEEGRRRNRVRAGARALGRTPFLRA